MELMKKFLSRFDFSIQPVTILPLLILVLTYPAMKWLPNEYCYENHLIENFQLVILGATMAICLKAKTDKKFFISLFLVCIILFLREINCGRTIFFPIEGVENAFYSWKDIPYGYLAHPIYGLFMAGSFLYFILTKSYKVLFNYMLNAKLSFWNWLFLFLGIILGTIGEEISNMQLEEMTETLFYLSFMALIYLQAHNKNYIMQTENKNEWLASKRRTINW